ncbi:putative AC transposase, partial [Bienertia sinuspersici]
GENGSNRTNVTTKQRAPSSWVWQYFDKVPTNEPDRYNVTCKVCRDVKNMKKPKNYKWQKNDGTGTMSRHLRSEHGLGLEGEEGSSGGGQAQLHGYASDIPGIGMPFVYNRDRMITEFGKFIIADELPFSFSESPNYEYFNRVALQPQYRRVSRNTLKRHTQEAYYAYRSYLMEMFRTYDGRVSLNSDTWTSTYGEPFVCVVVHWIDDDWLL